ncbi:MAG: pilin [Patescibacteria group bacterium]
MKQAKLLNPGLLYIILLNIALWVLPLFVFAQDEFGFWETAHYTLPTGTPPIAAIIATIIQMILGLVGVVLLIMILYGGFQWMTSSGNEQKIAKAKAIFGGALIGMFVILGAYIITSFIMRSLYSSIEPIPTMQGCKVDGDCSQGQICTPSGWCVNLSGPLSDCVPECEFGQTCNEGVCLDSTPEEPEGEICPGVCLTIAEALARPGCEEKSIGRAFCEAHNSAWSCFVAKSAQTCTAP